VGGGFLGTDMEPLFYLPTGVQSATPPEGFLKSCRGTSNYVLLVFDLTTGSYNPKWGL